MSEDCRQNQHHVWKFFVQAGKVSFLKHYKTFLGYLRDIGSLLISTIRVLEIANVFLKSCHNIGLEMKYVAGIALCRVQYGKYFPSFSYFATYLKIAKFEKSNRSGVILLTNCRELA